MTEGSPDRIAGAISTYLTDFKEPSVSSTSPQKCDPADCVHSAAVSLGGAATGGGGQYFVDVATGRYYFQSSDGETVTMVDTGVPVVPGQLLAGQVDKCGGMGDIVEQQNKADLPANQVVLCGGSDDQFETLTIVPNDVPYRAVSYEGNKKEQGAQAEHMTVYDFETKNDADYTERMDFDDESKVIEMMPPPHSEEIPYNCSDERGFKTIASLLNQVNTHTGFKPHKCKYCEASFTTSGELVRHVRHIHKHEKPHRCPECQYMSVERSKLKKHMSCHSGERPYQCPHCTYAGPTTYKLKRHLRTHTGKNPLPFGCDICHVRFTQMSSLKAHITSHTGEKSIYHCELCPTTCGRKTDLRIHVLKFHTSEMPMLCKMCGNTFPDKFTLKLHKKTHKEYFQCYH